MKRRKTNLDAIPEASAKTILALILAGALYVDNGRICCGEPGIYPRNDVQRCGKAAIKRRRIKTFTVVDEIYC